MKRHWARWLPFSLALTTAVTVAAVAAWADPPRREYAPDPPQRASRTQWAIDVAAKGTHLTPTRASSHLLPVPQSTPRLLGRYALELYIGHELLDRARFNVPLAGDGTHHVGRNSLPRPHFDDDIATVVHVTMADNPRAAYLLVVDRETGTTTKYDWPPESDGSLNRWQLRIDADDGGFFGGGDGGAAKATPRPLGDGG